MLSYRKSTQTVTCMIEVGSPERGEREGEREEGREGGLLGNSLPRFINESAILTLTTIQNILLQCL